MERGGLRPGNDICAAFACASFIAPPDELEGAGGSWMEVRVHPIHRHPPRTRCFLRRCHCPAPGWASLGWECNWVRHYWDTKVYEGTSIIHFASSSELKLLYSIQLIRD
jgi:hypothetical protein